jgi:8-oxo-dGTP pyrophosphatase MutT (NUDIX family)
MAKQIIAAGGLVFNDKHELLMIFRRGKWDLPKGKLDEGETIEACAVREVQEETGLAQVILQDFISLTYHEYFDEYSKQDAIKETHWYKMYAPNEQSLTPQTEEDIEQIEWVNENAIAEKLSNSYPNIIEIIDKLQH